MSPDVQLVAARFAIGDYWEKVQLGYRRGRIFIRVMASDGVHTGFNKAINAEIKVMKGRTFHMYKPPSEQAGIMKDFDWPDAKVWSVADCPRNRFQLDVLQKIGNPYERYDAPLLDVTPNRDKVRDHQREFISFGLTRKQCIIAGEMGTGKTLAAFEIMEKAPDIKIKTMDTIWYVAPKGVIKEINNQLVEWKCQVKPRLLTWENLVKIVNEWDDTSKLPQMLFLDEASRGKNPAAKRSQAAQNIADEMRKVYGDNAYVILMTGTPAPKNPSDWWSLCEIACPGFLREGELSACEERLAVFTEGEGLAGQTFKKRVAWLDTTKRCRKCGNLDTHIDHSDINIAGHPFIPSKNEVELMYRRMQGLVLVKMKKDCTSLPEKVYRQVLLPPSSSVLRAASALASRSHGAAQTLIRLRELSDGFQYREVEDGVQDCEVCFGRGVKTDYDIIEEHRDAYETGGLDFDAYCIEKKLDRDTLWVPVERECPYCEKGQQPRYIRTVDEVPCPKEDQLRNELDAHEDVGRLVVYAGFQASVDRCVRTALQEGWCVIRVDGRGWHAQRPDGSPITGNHLDVFQREQEAYPKVCFVGQPGAAGMGLTLTASPTIVYYSNDFNAESRIQSEDRIHRLGMNETRGATIVDLIHLPSDLLVLNNLKEKRRLQAMTLGQISEALNSGPVSRIA